MGGMLGKPVPWLEEPIKPEDGWKKLEVWVKQPKTGDAEGEPVMLIGVTQEGEGENHRFIFWENSQVGCLHHDGDLRDEFELEFKRAYSEEMTGCMIGSDWSLFGLKLVMPKIVVKGVKEDAG